MHGTELCTTESRTTLKKREERGGSRGLKDELGTRKLRRKDPKILLLRHFLPCSKNTHTTHQHESVSQPHQQDTMTSSDEISQVDYSPLLNPTDSEDDAAPEGQQLVELKAPVDLQGGYELAVTVTGKSMVVVVVSRPSSFFPLSYSGYLWGKGPGTTNMERFPQNFHSDVFCETQVSLIASHASYFFVLRNS